MNTAIFVIIFVALGLTVVLAAMRAGGRRSPETNSSGRGGRRAVAIGTALAVLVFAVAIPVAVGIDGSKQAEAGPVKLTASQEAGREKFAKGCQQCHTLAAANATGRVGPNLDAIRPPKELTLNAIEQGRARGRGQMPALLFTGKDAEEVADFVAATAGRG